MAYSEKKKEYDLRYAKERLHRVPLDLQQDFYEEVKAAAANAGESLNGFIKTAIRLRLDAVQKAPLDTE